MGTRAKILGIYGLLLTTAICISAQILFSGKAVQKTTDGLLSSNVPLLADIGVIKSSLIEHERSQYEYYATTDRQAMLAQHQIRQPRLSAAQNHIRTLLPGDPRLEQIDQHMAQLTALSQQLDKVLSPEPVNWDQARSLLGQITAESQRALPLLEALESESQAAVLSTSDLVSASASTTTQLVFAFCALALLVAGLVAFYLERFIRLAAERSFLAFYDPLTSLPNRQQFEAETKDAEPAHGIGMLGLIKLDRFNLVTAGHGLATGDAIIKATAQRINKLLPKGGQLYRFEGATFAVVTPFLPHKSWFEEFLQAFEQPLKAQHAEFYLSVSVAYCVVPDDGNDYLTLMKNADACLSRVASNGGNAFRRYTPDLFQREQTWFTLENELRDAISSNQLVLFYQPQVNAQTLQVIGMEALIRWHSPTRGMVSPATFIPLAEQTGLIVKIGDWVLHEACKQALLWYKAFEQECVVAVNISPKQFMHPGFVDSVSKALRETRVPSHLVELEITEGVMVENTEQSIEILNQLKNLGLKLSIDDFGTGYSSLVYLKRFNIDKLKVDQAFIRNLENDAKDEAIVRTIIDMAQNLNLKVIAEGVETAEQQAKLQDFGCDELQGYLISKPKEPGALLEFFQPQYDPTDDSKQGFTQTISQPLLSSS